MSTERPKPSGENAGHPPSIRDFWTQPSSPFPLPIPSGSPEIRRTRPRNVRTPSLWNQPQRSEVRAASPAQHPQAVPVSTPYAQAEVVPEEMLASLSEISIRVLRERLQQRGVSSLSTPELLSIALGTSAVASHVQTLLNNYNIRHLLNAEFGELSNQYGLGKAKAAQLLAVLEVARRLTMLPEEEAYTIRTPADAAKLVSPEMEYLDYEVLRVLLLDTKNQVLGNLLLYQGTINSSVLRSAEIFRPAVTRKCPGIIICHNHPSGDPQPSEADIAVTKGLVEAGKLLEVDLVDHIVIGHNGRFVSLKERMGW